jgi:hypothetical protein
MLARLRIHAMLSGVTKKALAACNAGQVGTYGERGHQMLALGVARCASDSVARCASDNYGELPTATHG